MQVRAQVRGLRRSPTKVRPILGAIKGKPAAAAIEILRLLPSPVAAEVAKAVKSAMANAENNYGMLPSRLQVVAVSADPGPTWRRFKARARGRISPIIRRTCHVTVAVDEV
jgi:large subunit ribosomal protein L22